MEKAHSTQLHCDGKDPDISQQLHVGSANCNNPKMHFGDIKLVSGEDENL